MPFRPRTLRVTVIAVVVVLLSTLAIGYVSWRSADELVHPERVPRSATPADAGLAFEDVTFTTSDGVPLVAWWMPADEAPRDDPTVLFLHGYGDSKNQSLEVAPFLHEAGFNVLAFDFRAHGESGGAFTTVGLDEVRDVHAAVAYLASRGDVDADRLALFGWSMGGAAALNAAPALPGVRAVVTDSAFASLDNIVANSITHFTGLPKYPFGPVSVAMAARIVDRDVSANNPSHSAAALTVPLFVIHGSADAIADADDDAMVIANAAGGPVAFWIVEDATHVNVIEKAPELYAAHVTSFLTDNV